MTRNKLQSFMLAPLFALIVLTAAGGEALTTWRVGDMFLYRTACHTEEDILDVARAEYPNEMGAVMTVRKKCFSLQQPARAVMVRWIAGPFKMPGNIPASAWEILDQFGDTEFLIMRDSDGPHNRQQDAS